LKPISQTGNETMRENITLTRDIEQSSIRELSLDEAEAVGGGFGPIGQVIATGLGAGLGVGLGAGIKAGGQKVGQLLGNGGGKHVKGGPKGKHAGAAKKSIAGYGTLFGSLG
jgi:hypothetical protein